MATPDAHALLGPSSAARWLACTPSARLEAVLPDSTSQAAEEGTLAHAIGELYAMQHCDLISARQLGGRLKKFKEHKLFQPEMLRYCGEYAQFILEKYNDARATTPDALIMMERKVDLTAYVPESFGTVDNTIIADGLMEITDLKYGKGVEVSAIENKQLMLYALGSLEEYSLTYDIDRVRMTIYQPRIDNISSFEMTVEELQAWGESIKPKAQLAFKGEGELVTGDHCRFCKVKATCRARSEENMALAKKEFATPPTLTDEEIEEILPQLKELAAWAKDIQDYAFGKALEGHKWEGFKLVAGRSIRAYADEFRVVQELTGMGFTEEDLFTQKLKGLTDMQKQVGKTVMSDLEIQGLIVKPEGKPTLVPESDKRPEIQSENSAVVEFGEAEII